MVRLGLVLALLGLLLPAVAAFLLGAAAARMADQQPTLVVPIPDGHVDLTLMPGARLRPSCVGAATWSACASDGQVLAASGSTGRAIVTGSIAPRRCDVFDVPPDGRVVITAANTGTGGVTLLLHDADTGPAPLAFAGAAALVAAPLLLLGGSLFALTSWWRRRRSRPARRRATRKRRPAPAR